MLKDISSKGDFVSGFWHQIQERGHPLKNITVRIPGPSSREFLLISAIKVFIYLKCLELGEESIA